MKANYMSLRKKKVINVATSFSILLLLSNDRPKLAGAVFKTTCTMKTFGLFGFFRRLLLLILLSLANVGKGQ